MKNKVRIIALLAVLCMLFSACTEKPTDTSSLGSDIESLISGETAESGSQTEAPETNAPDASAGETENAPVEDTEISPETNAPVSDDKPAQTDAPVQTDAPAVTTQAETQEPQENDYDRPITPAANYNPVFSVPEYTSKPYVAVNGNEPFFTEDELTTVAFEYYSPLDSLNRCGYAFACVGEELMPTGNRGSISYKPTGWVQNEYSFVDGRSLYNRCHMIAWQLTGENNNKQNLLTGTRYLNVQGMIPFEEMVGDYVRETGNHVMYRVTPIYEGNNLLANGVLIEGWSVEDEGDGICFNVYSYNVQPGVDIDYKTGNNSEVPGYSEQTKDPTVEASYVVNKGNSKVHLPECASVGQMKETNRIYFVGTLDELKSQYPDCSPCGSCHPY